MSTIEVPFLNESQVDAILREALNRKLFELDVNGELPAKAEDKASAAHSLVAQAVLARAAGNRGDDVMAMLFIAEVDMQPIAATNDRGGTVVSAQSETGNQFENVTDELLRKFEGSLQNYPESEKVADELAQIRAEMARRGMTADVPSQVVNGTPAPPQENPVVQGSAPVLDDAQARAALEDQLTVGIMRAHGIDPSEVASISIETLQWVIDHPQGGQPQVAAEPQHEPVPAPPAAPPVQTAPVSSPTDVPVITPEREELEAQITGPMLKAYGRGRRDVPEIGDHELRFMVANPEARVTKEMLEAERAKDLGTAPASVELIKPSESVDPSSVPEQPVAEAFAPPVAEMPVEAPPVVATPSIQPLSDEQNREIDAKVAAARQIDDRAEAIIEREHFPLPPEIDEQAPRLPFDMSALSREDIYSLHARFHACESRATWVVTQEEDALSDIIKLRRAREVDVANELPSSVERKKITDAQRESMIAADEEVRRYLDAEHEINKTLRKLKVLRDNYHRDVERCSRQLTRWSAEYGGAR